MVSSRNCRGALIGFRPLGVYREGSYFDRECSVTADALALFGKEARPLTAKELRAALGCDTNTVQTTLRRLTKRGVLVREGRRRRMTYALRTATQR
jgi:predicted HTH transcriptional regulator